MTRKKNLIIILAAVVVALIVGFTGSYHYIKYVYLREQIETNVNAKELLAWYETDNFVPPADNRISEIQLINFFKVNHDLIYLVQKVHDEIENNRWLLGFEVLKMQPEWLSAKYTGLKKYQLSPLEYDWIVRQVIYFWFFRWQENSMEKLRDSGWTPDSMEFVNRAKPPNYYLFLEYEDDLDLIFELLWPEHSSGEIMRPDSVTH